MDQVTQAMAASAATDGGGVSPLFFVIGALALIVVSTLGPLSRLHERRATAQRATSADADADADTAADTQVPADTQAAAAADTQAAPAAAASDTDPAPHA